MSPASLSLAACAAWDSGASLRRVVPHVGVPSTRRRAAVQAERPPFQRVTVVARLCPPSPTFMRTQVVMISSVRRGTAIVFLIGTTAAVHLPAQERTASQPATAYALTISRTIQNGLPVTLEFRGIAAGGVARLDITGGTDSANMPPGSYLLVTDSSGAARLVDTATRTVQVIGAGARLGGLVELYTPPGSVTDVHVKVDTLGDGELLEGRRTRHYRITTSFSLGVTGPSGQVAQARSASVTELWQAEGTERVPNPFVGLGGNGAPGDFLSPFDDALVAIGRRLSGITLRSETHASLSARGIAFTQEHVVTRLSALRSATVDPASLRVPLGYTVK